MVRASAPEGNSSSTRTAAPAARHVPLGTGSSEATAFWLLDPLQDTFYDVHGPLRAWTIQRPESMLKVFPKLRQRKLHQRHHDLAVTGASASGSQPVTGGLVRMNQATTAVPVPVRPESESWIDVTEFLEPQQLQWPACSTTAAVHVPSSPATAEPPIGEVNDPTWVQEHEGQQVFVGSSTSPRRTKMIGFTCKRCQARSYKPINPLSFSEGTLVVQCGKCQCWHKIKDSLNIFSEMADVFPDTTPRVSNEDLPPGLRLPLDAFYWFDVDDHQQN